METSELFFSGMEAPLDERRWEERQAKLLCARCPVSAECLEAALEADEQHGVWGGYSARERRRMFGRRQPR